MVQWFLPALMLCVRSHRTHQWVREPVPLHQLWGTHSLSGPNLMFHWPARWVLGAVSSMWATKERGGVSRDAAFVPACWPRGAGWIAYPWHSRSRLGSRLAGGGVGHYGPSLIVHRLLPLAKTWKATMRRCSGLRLPMPDTPRCNLVRKCRSVPQGVRDQESTLRKLMRKTLVHHRRTMKHLWTINQHLYR